MKKAFLSLVLCFISHIVCAQRIDNGVLYIEEGTTETTHGQFRNNTEIKDIHFPSSLSTIGYLTFNNVPGLTTITIPSTVKTVSGWAFSECENLRKVIVEEGVTNIKECAFYNSMVDTFVLPKSVIELCDWTLSAKGNCVVCCEYGSYAYNFARKEGFKVCITGYPEEYVATSKAVELVGETVVPDSLFYNREKLEYVRLSYGLERIGSAAFLNTSVSEVDIPSSVSYIADDAFNDDVEFRCVKGTYAEQWLLAKGYHLKCKISDLCTYTNRLDEFTDMVLPAGVDIYNWNSLEAKEVLSRYQTVSDMLQYGFYINRPINIQLDGDSLVVTSYYLHPLKGAYLGLEGETFTPLAFFDVIEPLAQVKIPAPEAARYGKLDVIANDDVYNTIRSIRIVDSVSFSDIRWTEGDVYTWEVLSPIQAREWIYMFTNMCYIMNLPEFETKLYSYAGKSYDDADGKNLLYLDDLKDLYQRILSKTTTQLRRCGGDAWGLAYVPGYIIGLSDWGLMKHYQSPDNYSAAFHEFSHSMGYGHDGNMTSGKKPIGKEDDENEEFYGFEAAAYSILKEHLAQDKVIYNDVSILNSYDMYATELTCDRVLGGRIEHYGEPKAKGPALQMKEQIALVDSSTVEAKIQNTGAYFSNLVRVAIYRMTTNDTLATAGLQYVSLEEEQQKTKLFHLANDSLASGKYRVELQYYNSFEGEWQLPEPSDLAIIEWELYNPLIPEEQTYLTKLANTIACVAYPNPTNAYINLETRVSVNSISVYNVSGNLLNVVESSKQIDLSQYPSGQYLLKVETDEGCSVLKVTKR